MFKRTPSSGGGWPQFDARRFKCKLQEPVDPCTACTGAQVATFRPRSIGGEPQSMVMARRSRARPPQRARGVQMRASSSDAPCPMQSRMQHFGYQSRMADVTSSASTPTGASPAGTVPKSLCWHRPTSASCSRRPITKAPPEGASLITARSEPGILGRVREPGGGEFCLFF